MKNNKGFTLVELLAVVVLIGILSVVAVSTYRGVNESAKKKSLEAKIEHITSAAEKWGRENNITNKTNISVNALVVEGYITADEVSPDGLATITNPLTGENMICNTIDIFFENGQIKTKYNADIQNCKLAKQSLIDNKINVTVIDSNNTNISGTGSIAKWTNKDIIIIVNSSDYDNKATSISYDFEGNTVTKSKSNLQKYTGNTFLTETQTANYYNVFYIKSELIFNSKIVVGYEIPGEGTKSRAYTIRFDKEEATATVKSNSEWLTTTAEIAVVVDDGKGSGPKNFYLSTNPSGYTAADRHSAEPVVPVGNLDVGKYYIWTEDNAGNISSEPKLSIEINNIDTVEPECKVNFHGTKGRGHWFKQFPVTPGGETTIPAGVSGINVGVSDNINNKVYTAFAAYNTTNEGIGEPRTTNTTRAGQPYYCHAKTLAGIYASSSETLWLDMTPPTITLSVTSDTNYTRTKSFSINVHDDLSGIPQRTEIRYGWALAGQQPTSWSPSTYTIPPAEAGDRFDANMTITGQGLTGIYYLHIDYSDVEDYAGNFATRVNGTGADGIAIFGPYMFDNTPPACGNNNGKTNWTNGTYTIRQYCRDNEGTADQSGCAQTLYVIPYYQTDNVRTDSVVIRDSVGLETTCNYDVYLEHINPSCSLTEPGPDGLDGWYKSDKVTISASFQDNGAAGLQSGVESVGTAKTSNTLNGNYSVEFDENGNPLRAYCYVKDVAGNTGSNHLDFKKDDGAEATNGGCYMVGGNTSWLSGPVTWGYSFSTPPISGCKGSSGVQDGTTWSFSKQCGYSETMTFGSIKGYGLIGKTTYIQSSNSGAPIECAVSINLFIDTYPPVCKEIENDSTTWQQANRTVSVNCRDYVDSAGVDYTFWNSQCTQDKFSKTFNTTTEVGQIEIEDIAGNTKKCPVNVYVDKSAPTCKASKSDQYDTDGVNVTITCSDNGSGVKSCNGGTTYYTNVTSGATYSVTDNVGRTGSCSVSVSSYGCGTCSDCYYGHNTCQGGYYWDCAVGSCTSTTPSKGATCLTNSSCAAVYSSCLTGENTCSYGCSDTCYY